MSKKSRNELIHEALNLLDEDMIEDVDRLRGNAVETTAGPVEVEKGIKNYPWRRMMAIAASICLLLIGSWAWSSYIGPLVGDGLQSKDKEVSDGVSNKGDAEMDNNIDMPLPEDDTKDDLDIVIDPEQDGESGSEMKNAPDNIEPDEPKTEIKEWVDILGDKYSLQDNYVSISMLPHKAWESSASEEDAMKQAVVIGDKHEEDFDKLVEAMSSAYCVLTEEIPESNPDMVYHLFFEKEDGEVVHCWLLEDGYLYYNDISEICLDLDEAIYGTIFKILAMYL